ncbi:MAG: Rne/Rng family ribonuclease [Thermoanaerobaculia bacterium]
MRKQLLVNVTPPETRVALTEDGRTVEVFHERSDRQGLVGNVYLGRIRRVLPGMQAAFVSVGLDRDAFLYVEDAFPRAGDWSSEEGEEETAGDTQRPAASRIEDLVREGEEIVVQVTKDPLSGKGPRVTVNITLPGHTLVYLPGGREIAVSRRITEEAERQRLLQILEGFPGPGGFIVRTAGQGRPAAELAADRQSLVELSGQISRRAQSATAPALLHRELDLPLRIVRDLVTSDFAAIRVDNEATRERIAEFLSLVGLVPASRVELHERPEPIFELYGVESEIEDALKSHVTLPSGGSVVIHQTEALVAIDVNTGKFVGKAALEDTVFSTNLEAIREVARQIRLRDLGGLLVVDFIDMQDPEHRREVFERFEAELAKDRVRTRLLPLSDFGLIEVTRQRSRGNLEKTLTGPCPCCGGTGRAKTDLTVALEMRRALWKTSSLCSPGQTVRVKARPSVLRVLREQEPSLLTDVEGRLKIRVEMEPDETLPPARFEVLPDQL